MAATDPRENSGRHRAEAFVAQAFHALNDVIRKMNQLYHVLAIVVLFMVINLAITGFNNYILWQEVSRLLGRAD